MDAYCVTCTTSSPSASSTPTSPASSQSIAAVVLPTSPAPPPPALSYPAHHPLPPSSFNPYQPVVHSPFPASAPVSPYPSQLYHYPPHMSPSLPYVPPSSPLVSGPAGFISPPPLAPFVPPSPSLNPHVSPSPSAAQVSAVFSEYQDLDSPRYYDLPSASTGSVAALTF